MPFARLWYLGIVAMLAAPIAWAQAPAPNPSQQSTETHHDVWTFQAQNRF